MPSRSPGSVQPHIESVSEPKTSCYMVREHRLELTQEAVDYYRGVGVNPIPCDMPPSHKQCYEVGDYPSNVELNLTANEAEYYTSIGMTIQKCKLDLNKFQGSDPSTPLIPQAFAEEQQQELTWYYVKRPSGVCERLNVSQNFVDRMTQQGWIFSLTDICPDGVSEQPKSVCPRNCNVIHIPTGIVSYEGMCSCSTIERYEQDPDYRVEFTTQEPEVPIVSEPETVDVDPPGVVETRCYMVYGQKLELTEQAVGYYIDAGVTVTPCDLVVPPTPTTPAQESGESCEAYRSRLQSLGWSVDWISDCPTPTPTPTKPSEFGIAGILFAGVLAVPILSGLGKWK